MLKEVHTALAGGDVQRAESRCRDALAAFGPRADVLANLGTVMLAQHRFADAIAALSAARAGLPEHPGVLANLGLAHLRGGQPKTAIEILERAVALDHGQIDALNNLGLARAAIDDFDGAAAAFDEALARAPGYTPALSNWCDMLVERGALGRARDVAERFASSAPEQAGALFKVGYLRILTGDFELARMALDRAATLEPRYAPTHHNLGTLALWENRLDSSIGHFRDALGIDERYFDARFGLACALLKLRRAEDGWQAFEGRHAVHTGELEGVAASLKPWDGRVLPQGTLLVLPEEGLGDMLQFVRFLPEARRRVQRLVLLCDDYWAPLTRLVETSAGIDAVVGRATGALEIAAACKLLSLPRILGLGEQAFEPRAGYLSPPEQSMRDWAERMRPYRGLRVGLCWGGNPRHHDPYANRINERRSVGLDRLIALASVPDTHFFSLQKGADITATRLAGFPLEDWTIELGDFGDTAALIANLDLVISVDTSIVHCAGAIGCPVWMLDRFDNCWRWGTDPTAPGWYQTLRVFRQTRFGDWDTVILQLRDALAAEAARHVRNAVA
jgi:Tfp pilus assembly protein PilF